MEIASKEFVDSNAGSDYSYIGMTGNTLPKGTGASGVVTKAFNNMNFFGNVSVSITGFIMRGFYPLTTTDIGPVRLAFLDTFKSVGTIINKEQLFAITEKQYKSYEDIDNPEFKLVTPFDIICRTPGTDYWSGWMGLTRSCYISLVQDNDDGTYTIKNNIVPLATAVYKLVDFTRDSVYDTSNLLHDEKQYIKNYQICDSFNAEQPLFRQLGFIFRSTKIKD